MECAGRSKLILAFDQKVKYMYYQFGLNQIVI